ncbi:sensor histidine kinase [Brevibacillus sp. SYSU BS000544]|uniref:sensor histidine kinase n=1 Tax=Brevibacillus sp. SYSU BS000544 TaxID=3416443 RepID=UPI003CE45875
MRKSHVLHRLKGIVSLLTATTVCFSVAILGTSLFYDSIGWQPSFFLMQLINGLVGFFAFGFMMYIVGRALHPRRRAAFQPILEALKRMAKGDFDVKLNLQVEERHPFSELAQSINHMAVELSQMERMRQEFISNVSHEIQSPLTSISGFARALQNEELSAEERNHYLAIIETESLRLSKLSDNLLKLTSLESEHHPFEPTSYRLDKQLRKIVLSCEPQWMEKELKMDVDLEEVNLIADEDLLSQVWVNLISNCIKFTPNGGTIGIHLRLENDRVVVRISDTGIGIALEDQEHIFERFYKVDKSRNRFNGGSGLGLAIVKKIVEIHQGSISVQSKPGKGATFTVTLPFEPGSSKES